MCGNVGVVAPPTLVLTGTPCAGKSTVAQALARTGDDPTAGDPTALVDLDAVRVQVKSGYRLPMAVIPPPDETLAQWQVAVDICGDMARRYAAADYACIVDAPGIYPDGSIPWEPYTWSGWRRALGGVDWRLVVLQPDIELICERAVARQGATTRRHPPCHPRRHGGVARRRRGDRAGQHGLDGRGDGRRHRGGQALSDRATCALTASRSSAPVTAIPPAP